MCQVIAHILIAAGVAVVVGYVVMLAAASVAPESEAYLSSLDLGEWGTRPEDLCMVVGCVSPWEHDTAGWRECAGHMAQRTRV
jgi:hypothetical protein